MSQRSDISSHIINRDTAPVNSQDQVFCHHGELLPLLTSHSARNPGRQFYSCRRAPPGDRENCGFFVWADELAASLRESRREAIRDTTVNAAAATPQRPSGSQAQRAQTTRSPDTPIPPQKRQRSPSPLACYPLPATIPKRRRLSDVTSTPDGLTTRMKPSQGHEARLENIAEGLAAASREQQGTPSDTQRLPQSHAFPSASSTVPPRFSPPRLPAMQAQTPMRGKGVLHSPRSTLPSSQGARSEAAYDEVRRADREDEIEDAVWIEHELDLENKRVKTDPIEDDEYFDEASTIDVSSTQASRSAMSSPSSSIPGPFTLPSTRTDVDDDIYFGSGASDPTQWRDVFGPSPARLPPQTPSSRQARSSRAYASGGNVGEIASGGHTMNSLLTPPGSQQRERDHQPTEDGVSSPSMGRRGRDSSVHSPLLREGQSQGRGLDSSPSPSSPKTSDGERSWWQMIQNDPHIQENPFHERATALRASSQTQTSPAIDAASGSADGLSAPLSADLVEQQVASLAGLPEYIRKLERKERAAQKSAEVKAKRIARLAEEIQRLKATVAALEARR